MGLVIEKERKKRQEDCGVFQTSTWDSECPATTCYYVHNILSLKVKKKNERVEAEGLPETQQQE